MTAIKILLGVLMCISLVWGSLNPHPYDKHEPTQHMYITGNIAHIDGLSVTFENNDDSLVFNNKTDLYEWVEKQSAYDTCIHGYKDDFNWMVQEGYVYAITVYNDDEKYTELIYDGPNWTVNALQDTSYVITVFNTVEKLYNQSTKSFEFDSYTVK